MKNRILLFFLVLLLLGLLAGSNTSAGKVTAQGDTQVNWWVFGGGGGSSGGEDVLISATVGQAISGSSLGGVTELYAGYWHPGFGPTKVEITFFEATWRDEQVLVTWKTAEEIDLLGFNLYRSASETGQWVQVNPVLIPSQYLGQPLGGTYTWLDEDVTSGEAYFYTLEAVDTQVRGAFTGPVRVNYQMHLPLIRH